MMMTMRMARRMGALALAVLVTIGAAGCSSDILNYNLRSSFSTFMIGVFSDSVNAAVQPY